jgi:type II secretory pathway pseudopilin PulG
MQPFVAENRGNPPKSTLAFLAYGSYQQTRTNDVETMMPTTPTRRAKPSEDGFILVAVMFLIALILIGLMVAAPRVAADIQRDREIETFHRGLQYRRAVQVYFKKFQRYPPSVDALVKTNNIRFLRKKYIDPITGKDDWKPIMMGQNKAPLAMGFFGQPLGGLGMGGPLAGVGPGGVGTPMGSGAFNPGIGAADPNANPTDPNAANAGNAGTSANPTDPNAGTGGSQIAGANPVAGPTFGGAGIVGFSPASPKPSILVYKKKTHYNEWEFTYSPLSDTGLGGMQNAPPQLLGGQAPGTGGMSPTPAPTPTPTPAPTSPQ